MKILTLNCGSSTVKHALFDMPDDRSCRNHPDALEWLMGFLTRPEQGVVEELSQIDAVERSFRNWLSCIIQSISPASGQSQA